MRIRGAAGAEPDAGGAPRVPQHPRQGRTLAGGGATRGHRTGIGDFAQRRVGLAGRVGRRLAPTSMAGYISVVRTFFRDCQEWGWCARRFDPAVALATPRSVRTMLGPRPRVIADGTWAKILWAGLNLAAG